MNITKEELQKLYLENENKIVCKKLKISNATLVSYLNKNNIPLKGRGNRKVKGKLIIL